MNSPFQVLDEAYDTHKPVAVRALFSGGHDSLTATGIAFRWARKRGIDLRAAHINTQTGIPETSEFVRQTCRDQGWPLRELKPEGQKVRGKPIPRGMTVYEALVLEFGFPGPAQHGMMYQRLKERCLRQLVKEGKRRRGDRVMLVTGVRQQESVRRMRHVERVQRDGALVWAAPIWNFSKKQCHEVMDAQGLPRNPVVDILHMSGECLCGAFSRRGEMKELEDWYSDVAARLHALEEQVEAKGLRAAVWGGRHQLLEVHRDQMKLEVGPLCSSCVQASESAV